MVFLVNKYYKFLEFDSENITEHKYAAQLKTM